MSKVHRVYEFTGVQYKEGLRWSKSWFQKRHYEALADYHDNNGGDRYFKLIRDGILFNQYVGVIQVLDLTIEILPKTDKNSESADWHQVLLAMLRKTRALKVDTFIEASLKYKNYSILHLYIEEFLNQVEALVKRGLVKNYRKQEGNLKALKGALIFNEHLTKNLVHKERFYTRHQIYDRETLLNQILLEALLILKSSLSNSILSDKVERILFYFPDIRRIPITENTFENLMYNRKTQSYTKAIEIAKMIILNYSPDISSGKNNVLAIMFNMNALWEEYIFRTLQESAQEELDVNYQASELFWGSRRMKPDLIIQDKDRKYVADTKWKVNDNAEPSDEDLRQIFAYNKYWDVEKGFLLYPRTENSPTTEAKTYHKGFTDSGRQMSCQVIYLNVIGENGDVNRGLGIELLEQLRRV
ncbi:McrC family protein [Marivirga sp.]|uniref:McrC family protein n=1 Tax=Marivirga sp. TaxID=2018662 RepID=UPI002D80DFFD|nr:restriction endonuclease [Marivirga sp.]HET8860733.1 restriction endonuclease [Marivirga sp.]